MWWGRALEPEQLTGSGREIALGGGPQAEVADLVQSLVQSLGQDMLQEPAHELFAGDPAGAPAVGLAFLVAEGDAAGIEVDDAAVGNGDAEDVAGKVIEHRLLAVAPGGAMDNPRCRPDCFGDDQVRPALLERGPELAAHQPGQRL